MAMHVIIGWVVLVAALVSAGVVVTVIAVALRYLNRKGGPEIPGHIFVSPSRGLSPEQGSVGSAQCYWDCMSGFHWDEDWKERCAPACGLTEKHEAT
jgi:hypothetical protein